jgi:hypothetical protein
MLLEVSAGDMIPISARSVRKRIARIGRVQEGTACDIIPTSARSVRKRIVTI